MYKSRTGVLRASVWVGGMLLGCLAPPVFANSFAVSAVVCGSSASQTNTDQPASVSLSNIVCGNGAYGNAAARADSGGIGVAVDFYSFGLMDYAQSTGSIAATFVITGPGTAPIPVSLNFVLSGFLGGGTNANQVSYRTIENRVTLQVTNPNGASALQYYGSATESFNASLNPGLTTSFSGVLAPSGTNCLSGCAIVSPVFNVYPGLENSIELWARATVNSANGSGYGIASFLNTFYFPTNGPVFNLPDGYTASIAGLNVENNQVLGAAAVPEPGTYLLAGVGLSVLLIRKRLRTRSKPHSL